MDPDDCYIPDKPDSAGAHSVRSQLIVVSPRPSLGELEEAERAAGAGEAVAGEQTRSSSGSSQEPEQQFVFTNPIATMENQGEIDDWWFVACTAWHVLRSQGLPRF